MKWIGKIMGGVLGALALGPPGALIGALLGHQFDEDSEAEAAGTGGDSAEELAAIGERFFRATFRVMGYLAKADGRVSELEIAAARTVMSDLHLDAAQVRAAIGCFTEGKQPQFDLDAELSQLAAACRGRAGLARVFVEIQLRAALAGDGLGGPVRPLVNRIAAALSVSRLELVHIEAVLRIQRGAFRAADTAYGAAPASPDRSLEEAYRVLETPPGATDAEIVRAYRRQLHRHHPDKLKANGLPESMMAHAKQRTQQIIEAYELVCARRGIR
ncbi:MAG: co-chaperone DjlA [Gammaproteobacteria bacterium]|nr:co-chaperone DjlA [Gammaproteobacteria bacterium]